MLFLRPCLPLFFLLFAAFGAFAQPLNNNACNAIELTVGAKCAEYVYTNAFADEQANEPGCASGEVNSAWFKFVAPPSGRARITAKSPGGGLSPGNTLIGIYSVGNCEDFNTYSEISCEYENTANLDLIPGQTYFISVDGFTDNAGAFCLEVEDCPPPVNDSACEAISIPVDAGCTEYSFTNVCANGQDGEPGCTSGEKNSVWFTFVAPASGRVRISAKSPGGSLSAGNTLIGVYFALDCSSFNTFSQIACEFGNTENLNVVPGQTYYIQVDGFTDLSGAFCLEVKDCPAPVNDDVCNALPLTVDEGCAEYSYTNVCANAQNGEPGCTSGENNSVWFKFVAPPSGRVRINAKSPGGSLSAGNVQIGVFAALDCSNFNTFSQIACNFGSTINLQAVPGQTYFIKMDGFTDLVGTFCLEVKDCPAPVNDDACDALSLAVDGLCTGYTFSNVCANAQNGEPGCNSGEVNSVWFKFVAPPSGMVQVNAKGPGGSLSAGNTRISVYSVLDCNNFNTYNQLVCDYGDTGDITVNPGETYYIKVDGFTDRVGAFCLSVTQGPPPAGALCSNDNICNAIDLIPGEGCTFSTNECASFQMDEPYPSCFFGNSTDDFNSVWFRFVAPPSGRINLRQLGALNTQLAIYSLADCSNFASAAVVYCSRSSSNYVEGLLPGTTYYIQIDGEFDAKGEICLEVEECTPIPANDEVCDAISIPLGEGCVFSSNACSSFQNDEPFPSCFFGNATEEFNTVWYKFTAPPSGRINFLQRGSLNTQIALYLLPDCNDFNTAIEVYCSRNSSNFVTGLVPGQTYYVQVDGEFSNRGDICVEITECAPIPANDDACNAFPLVVGESCTFSSNECATFQNGEPYASCFFGNSTEEFNSVWFRFVAPPSGRVNIINSGALNTQLALYFLPDCSGFLGALEVYCSRANFNFVSDLVPGQTYFIQVDGEFSNRGEICLRVEECTPIPSNDDPCNAVPLTLGENCMFATNDCSAAQSNEPYPNCFFGSSGEDFNSLWYSFVAPASGKVEIRDNGDLNTQLAIYLLGDCQNYNTAIEIYCNRSENHSIDFLTPGQTYYIQLDGEFDAVGEVCLEILDPEAFVCPEPGLRFLSGTESGAVTYQAAGQILSEQTLTGSSDVEYLAGNTISLINGFSTEGAFSARIQACSDIGISLDEPVAQSHQLSEEENTPPQHKKTDLQEGELSIRVFPNPATRYLSVSYRLPANGEISIHLINLEGVPVHSVLNRSYQLRGDYQQQLDISDLPAGFYFIRTVHNDQVITQKVVITRS